jgi:hypothetical protein
LQPSRQTSGASLEEVQAKRAVLFHVRDGKITRVVWYWDRDRALAELGRALRADPPESCQVEHLRYVVSGRIHIAHQDGTAVDLGPGDAYRIEPGHDAWVLGDEPFVGVEFSRADRVAEA